MTKEHIIQFGVGIDDDAIISAVTENAEKKIIKDIKCDVLKKIFVANYYNCKPVHETRDGNIEIDQRAILSSMAENIVKEAVEEHIPDIIEKAAELLADSYRRTKKWKEKAEEVIQ